MYLVVVKKQQQIKIILIFVKNNNKIKYLGMSQDQIQTGSVKFFNKDKGFGFINFDNGGEIFFHKNDLQRNSALPRERDRVRFVVGEGKKGPLAQEVIIID